MSSETKSIVVTVQTNHGVVFTVDVPEFSFETSNITATEPERIASDFADTPSANRVQHSDQAVCAVE